MEVIKNMVLLNSISFLSVMASFLPALSNLVPCVLLPLPIFVYMELIYHYDFNLPYFSSYAPSLVSATTPPHISVDSLVCPEREGRTDSGRR